MRTHARVLAVTLLSLATSTASAAPPELRPTLVTRSLDNGLSLVVEEARRSPLVAIHVAIAGGTAEDPIDRRGLSAVAAEYLEHEASTRHVARAARAELFRELGVAPVSPEVRVEVDRTILTLRVPPAQLELALWVLSDLLAFAHDGVEPSGVARQRAAVAAAGARLAQRQQIERARAALLVADDHPLGRGALADAAAIEVADVRAHLRDRLGPERTTLAVVGDVDAARTSALVDKYFGPIVRGAEPPRRAAPPLAPRAASGVLHVKGVSRGVRVSWLTAPLYEADDVALDVLYQALTPRLVELLSRHGVTASFAAARERSTTLGSHFDVEVTSTAPTADVVGAIDAAIADVARGLDDAGLRAARATMLRKTAFAAETAAGRAALYADSSAQTRDALFVNKYLAAYEAVTADSLAQVVRRALVRSRRVVLTVVPDADAPAGGRLELGGGDK
ncbi:MAG: insulinase family protein [Polyangiaceae bacterium]|nr:insulinase family protein [Polyangiaceae bacterium]